MNFNAVKNSDFAHSKIFLDFMENICNYPRNCCRLHSDSNNYLWVLGLGIFMHLIVAIVFIILSLIIALFGTDRKFGFWGYFFCSLLLTPAIGLIILLASDKKKHSPGAEPGKTSSNS
jgi:hypothetical protein